MVGPVLQVSPAADLAFQFGAGHDGIRPAGRGGAKIAHPNVLVVDIDGDGSFLMNIQEMATCYCEKIPVKVMLLNNQHLGMVVQWEDRFHASNRAHTYLGPIHHPEALGLGNGIGPEERYPDFVTIARGFGWQGRSIQAKSDLNSAIQEMIERSGSLPARYCGPLSRARAADDPLRYVCQGIDPGVGRRS